jgi:hypothetical protein
MAVLAADSCHAVPGAEFLGKARKVRRRVHVWAQRDHPLMFKIATDAQKAYLHRTTPAPLSLLETTALRWKALGREGCLSQSVILNG